MTLDTLLLPTLRPQNVPSVSDQPDSQIGDTALGGPVINPAPITPENDFVDTPPLGDNKGWNGDNCHVNGDPYVPGVSDQPDYEIGEIAER